MQAAEGDKTKMPFKYTAGARNIFNQFKAKGWHSIAQFPVLCCARRYCSLVEGKYSIGFWAYWYVHHFADGFIYTIEGNKAANVAGISYLKKNGQVVRIWKGSVKLYINFNDCRKSTTKQNKWL